MCPECLGHVLLCFENTNLKVNLEKCMFAQGSVQYLGHIVTARGINPDLEKSKFIQNLQRNCCYCVKNDSGTTLGAVLSHLHDDKERPIVYACRKMNSAERHYSTTELLAVV